MKSSSRFLNRIPFVVGTVLLCFPLCIFGENREVSFEGIERSLVEVVGQKADGRHQTQGAGFFVSSEHILTHHHLVSFDRTAIVRLLADGAEYSTEVIARDEVRNLALLHIEGVEGDPVLFRDSEPVVGGELVVPRWEGETGLGVEARPGTLLTILKIAIRDVPDQPVTYFLHDRVGNSRDFGFPVLDRCNAVMGLQMADPEWEQGKGFFSGRPDPLPKPENWMAVLATAEIQKFIEPHTDWHSEDRECPSTFDLQQEEAERARTEAEEAAQEAEEAAERAAEAERDREVSEQERARAMREAEQAAEEAQGAREEAERLEEEARLREQELEEEKRRLQLEAEELQHELEQVRIEGEQQWERLRIYIGLAIALILLVLGIAAFILRRSRKSLSQANTQASEAERKAADAIKAAEMAPRPAPFSVRLYGSSESGEPFALQISELPLGREDGVTVGRSPEQSDYVIADEEVSREHFRLVVKNDKLWIVDLESVNGTLLDGVEMKPEELYELVDGSEIEIGAVNLQVQVESK